MFDIDKYIQDIFSNNNKTQFIMLCGLQGSGKSTFSQKFKQNGYEIISSDQERYELALKEEKNEHLYESEINDLQKYSKEAIKNCANKITQCLINGINCVYDATNTSKKARQSFLNDIKCSNDKFEKIAIFVDVNIETAIERNIIRSTTVVGERDGQNIFGRYVPQEVIKNKYKTTTLPLNEGFDRVYIIYNDNFEYNDGHLKDILDIKDSKNLIDYCMKNKELINNMFPEYEKVWDFDQKNSHHNLNLDMHILNVAKQLQNEKIELFMAGFLHDIAKPYTQLRRGTIIMDGEIFKAGEKVNIDKITKEKFVVVSKVDKQGYRSELLTVKHIAMDKHYHYYNHEIIGALIARRYLKQLGFTEEQCNNVYRYILNHMAIPTDKRHSEKTLKKILNNIGKDIIKDIMKIKIADRMSSNSTDETLSNMYFNFNVINGLVK